MRRISLVIQETPEQEIAKLTHRIEMMMYATLVLHLKNLVHQYGFMFGLV